MKKNTHREGAHITVNKPMRTSCIEKVNDMKPHPYVLWREMLVAYAAPAAMAGIDGIVSGDRSLFIAALTSIGGTSAFTAWILGYWLQKRSVHLRGLYKSKLVIVAIAFALFGCLTGIVVVVVVFGMLGLVYTPEQLSWLNRIWVDIPLSTTIACISTACRWHLSIQKQVAMRRSVSK